MRIHQEFEWLLDVAGFSPFLMMSYVSVPVSLPERALALGMVHLQCSAADRPLSLQRGL